MAAVIGSLRVVLGADTGSFEDGLKKAGSLLTSFGKITSGVAAGNLLAKAIEKTVAALADLVGATFHAIDAMDKMGKESQKIGVSVEELSKLTVAAKLSDVEITELSKSVVQLSKRLVEGADNGTAPARRALTALGISFKDFVGLKPDKQMEVLATRFSQFRDGADKTAAAVALFGRAGANLIPLLNEGSDGFRKASEMAIKLGLVMSGEASKSAQTFMDNMKLVGLALTQGVFNVIAEKLLPIFVLLSEGLLKVTVGFMHLIGAGAKMDKLMEDLRKKMNLPTDEAVRNAENFRKKLFELQVQTRTAQGDFAMLPEGFMQTAAALKLVGENAGKLPTTFAELTPQAQRLAFEMNNLKLSQLTAENMAPWDTYILKITQLNALMPITIAQHQALALEAAKAADKMASSYITATAGIAGSFSEMFATIGGEHKGWAQAAKIAAAAQALINTFQGVSLALAQGGVFGFAAGAAILAKGLALVASIKGTPLGFAQGGSFKVPGAGGMDSQMIPMMATPGELVTVETPEQQQRGSGNVTVQLRGKSFGFDDIRDFFDIINQGIRDGYKFQVVR